MEQQAGREQVGTRAGLSDAELEDWLDNFQANRPDRDTAAFLTETLKYWEQHEGAMGFPGGPASSQWRELQRRLRFRRLRKRQAVRWHVVRRHVSVRRDRRLGCGRPGGRRSTPKATASRGDPDLPGDESERHGPLSREGAAG